MRILSIAILALVFSSCSSVNYNRAEVLTRGNNIGALQQRVDAAINADVDILAPEAFQKAKNQLDKAIREAQKDKDKDAGNQTAEEGLVLIEKAENQAKKAHNSLAEALEKRKRARAAEAHLLFKSEYAALEKDLKQAGKGLEEGKNIQGLKENAALAASFADLELRALKVNISEKAENAYEAALKSKADRLAPITLKNAKSELDVARKIIDIEKENYEKAQFHAERARYLATRAKYIAEILTGFNKEKLTQEQIVLWYQDQLQQLHTSLPGTIAFDLPNRDVVAAFESNIRAHTTKLSQQASDLERLKKEANKPEKIDAFSHLGSLFDKKEAEILKRDNDVIIRSYGFQFPVGKAELLPSNFTLLNKIVSAIQKYPTAKIEVEGHTDSSGSNATNLRLSQERAKNIADFLVKVSGIDADRVSHVGRGEEKPIASNNTPKGREKNRRIEVIIKG